MATATLPRTVDDPGSDDPRVRWRPSAGGLVARLAVHALLLGAVLAAPLVVPDVQVNLVTRAVVFGIVALSMNVLLGYVGTVSLGHQAFVGVGAFTAGYVLTVLQAPWLVALAVAVVVGALQAVLVGVVALRVQGFFFAIVTLAYGLFGQEVVFNITALTGGGAGQPAARPDFATGDVAYAWLATGFLLLVWLFDWRLTSSRAGRAIRALRDDPRVAASWGIDVRAFTLLGFAISGGMAGVAGTLFASTEQIVSATTFNLTLALTFVLMTTVGGVTSRPGVVLGGFVFAGLGPVLTALHDTVGWGLASEDVAACSTAPPRVLQAVVGLALVGVAFELVHKLVLGKRPLALRVAAGAGALGLAGFGVVGLAYGAFTGGICMYSGLTPLLEPLIGVVLLLVTLIQFPGGIAEQLEGPLRWLSFGRFRAARQASVGGGAAGTAGGSRP